MASKSRSGVIRSAIGPIRSRLLIHITNGDKSIQLTLPTDIEGCQKTIDDLTELSGKIQAGIKTLSEKDQQWLNLIVGLTTDEDVAAEEQLYSNTALDEKAGYQSVVEYGKEVLCRLERKLTEVKRNLDALITQQSQKPTQINPVSTPTTVTQITAKLPKLVLPFFAGGYLEWPNFWNIYSKNIHDRNLSGAEKFAYLLGQLTGTALEAIEGIAVTDENYNTAIETLRERFERSSSELIGSLYSQLKRLPKSSDRVADMTKTYDVCEKIFRQLQTAGEDVDGNRSMVLDVLSKFPTSMVEDLMKHKNVGKHSSLKEIRAALREHIRKSEDFVELLEELTPFSTPGGSSQGTRARSQSTARPQFTARPTPEIGQSSSHETSALAAVASTTTLKGATSSPTSPCYFCQGKHFNSQCPTFNTVDRRCSRLTEIGRCTRCLSDGHLVGKCSVPEKRIRCYFCNIQGKHPSPLCPNQFGSTQSESEVKSKGASNHSSSSDGLAAFVGNPPPLDTNLTCLGDKSCLPTALARVVDPLSNCAVTVRILFDTGSHRTYITEKCSQTLRLQSVQNETINVAVFGSTRSVSVPSRVVSFAIQQTNGSMKQVNAHTIPLITDSSVASAKLHHMDEEFIRSMGYVMAEPIGSTNDCVDILIGSDFFWDFVFGEKIDTPSGMCLIPSTLGYLLGGCYSTAGNDNSSPTLLCLTETFGINSQLSCGLKASKNPFGRVQPDIEDFWSLEKIGITDDPITKDDDVVLQRFNDSIYFQHGRYHVKWPWKGSADQLPANYELALGRFRSLAKRLLTSDDEILTKYQGVIDQQLRDGIIERVPESDIQGPRIHYLPHHPIVKPDSATTKVRIVYDASARTRRDNPSLNECLYRGPVLLPDLCALLIRFRTNNIAIVADVEKAFLQVCLQPEDRDVTRFLWFADSTNPQVDGNIAAYRFLRVPFGMISSPFLLGGTIKYHLKQQTSCWVAQLILLSMYVDNLITGCNTDEKGIELYTKAKQLFQDAGMNLQEWCTNSAVLTHHIAEADKAKQRSIKVLGMIWDSVEDTIRLNVSLGTVPDIFSKRHVLQVVASLYDPLGLFQPVFIRAKHFLQTLWQKNVAWDEPLSGNDQIKVKQLCDELKPVSTIRIPRNPTLDCSEVTDIVVFCDASKIAYAACVYVRRWDKSARQFVASLVYSKSRLAPAKKTAEISLPRLELLGVTIGTRAGRFVREALSLPQSTAIYVFSDSQCVLFWLHSIRPLSVFVENRVRELQSLQTAKFLYVKTSENPADYSTRGMSVADLDKCSTWWQGPEWLTLPITEWDTEFDCNITPIEASAEFRKTSTDHQTLLAAEAPDPDDSGRMPMGIDITKYSSLRKLQRVSVWVFKFLKTKLWCKLSNESQNRFPELMGLFGDVSDEPFISRMEYVQVRRLWVRSVQNKYFNEIVTNLAENNNKRNRRLHLIHQLGLRLDDDDIIRCYGRFEHADLPPEAMRPKLLPKSSPFTSLVIRDIHERLLHSGVAHTLSQIRREFWIPQGRSAVRKLIKRCLPCRRYTGGPFILPRMPPWPRERMSPSSPFRFTGLDYLGPITVKIGSETQKVWVCLFTCMAIRAVHLEWVADCSSKQFLDCMIRFISRRGAPERIISDNAPQFRVVKTAYDRIWHSVLIHNDVTTFTAERGIEWSFITELAPWQGGFYERLVSLVKRSFRFAIGRRLLIWSEFLTLCCEVEALINSRPITYLHSDLESGRALRPIDFLTDLPVGTPESSQRLETKDFGDAGKHLLQYWKFKQGKLQSLWEFWRSEYLLSLRERGSAEHRHRRNAVHSVPTVGEVVLVKDSDVPRGAWKLGRVESVIQSSDGAVRSVQLALPSKIVVRRSVNHIYPLEVPTPTDRNNTDTDGDEDFDGFTVAEVNEAVQRVRGQREQANSN